MNSRQLVPDSVTANRRDRTLDPVLVSSEHHHPRSRDHPLGQPDIQVDRIEEDNRIALLAQIPAAPGGELAFNRPTTREIALLERCCSPGSGARALRIRRVLAPAR